MANTSWPTGIPVRVRLYDCGKLKGKWVTIKMLGHPGVGNNITFMDSNGVTHKAMVMR